MRVFTSLQGGCCEGAKVVFLVGGGGQVRLRANEQASSTVTVKPNRTDTHDIYARKYIYLAYYMTLKACSPPVLTLAVSSVPSATPTLETCFRMGIRKIKSADPHCRDPKRRAAYEASLRGKDAIAPTSKHMDITSTFSPIACSQTTLSR